MPNLNKVLYGTLDNVDAELEEGASETAILRAAIQNLCRKVIDLERKLQELRFYVNEKVNKD